MNLETRRLEREQQIAAWEAKWPNACKTCHGRGENIWQENQSPLGSGYVWMETLGEPCDDCSGQNKCPRCGATWADDSFVENSLACPACNWNWGANSDDARPEPFEDYYDVEEEYP